MHQMSRLIRVRHTDEDVQRRGVNIILMAAGLHIMALLLTIYAGFAGRLSTQVLIPVAISLIVQTIVIVLARRGSVDLAGESSSVWRLSVSLEVRSSVTTLSSRRCFS